MRSPGAGATALPHEPTLRTDSDAVDATLAASGDAHAFERLYRGHLNRIHGLARRMLSDDEADEAVQDVFVRAWQKLATFRGESAFGTWLHRLAVNVLLSRRETIGIRRKRHVEGDLVLDVLPSRRATPEAAVDMLSHGPGLLAAFGAALGCQPDGAIVLHRKLDAHDASAAILAHEMLTTQQLVQLLWGNTDTLKEQ